MEQNQEMMQMKHFCKLCSKSFPCGRSLGGHMRSHLIINSSETGEKIRNLNSGIDGYVLRENPKKTCKFAESSGGGEDALLQEKVCKECGKSFLSWKALFGHMKCHSEKIAIVANNKSKNQADSLNVTDSHSDDDSDEADEKAKNNNALNRKKRSRRSTKRYQVNNNATATNSSTLTAANSASENVDEHEQEEVAMSLIMLSRDLGNWVGFNSVTECSDNNSEFLGIGSSVQPANSETNKAKKVKPEKSKKKPKFESSGIPTNNKMKISEVVDKIKDHSADKNEFSFSTLDDSDENKKIKFECSTCNKSFHSYQALGGHRASHKKAKDSANAALEQNNGNSPVLSSEERIQAFAEKVESSKKVVKVARHECPICFKIFPSGQALGGHKRSHMIAEAKTINQQQSTHQMQKQPEICRDFLDLNLPAPIEEEEVQEDDEESHQNVGFQSWWKIESSYKHEQLVGPTF